MKKILLLIPLFLIFSINLKAACNYSDIKERNALASFVDYNYDFNDSNKTFDITIYNLKDNLKVKYNSTILSVNNGESKMQGLLPGTSIKLYIVSDDDCNRQNFRIININVPYVNKFYNNHKCIGHEELNICSSKYLDYELSEETFERLINKTNDEVKEEKAQPVEEKSIFQIIFSFLKKVYIPFILVLVTSLITTLVFSTILRKIKHGI